jgi:endonuclease/exonuclease/phosphatase family protein
MEITTVQWNVGGGKILEKGKDSTQMASYSQDGMQHIIAFLEDLSPDIITLQEVHSDNILNQADYIAQKLGLDYCVSDFFADSHLQDGQRLGNAIISKYPINDASSRLFLNLNRQMTAEDGSIWQMHDKGYTRCVIDLGQKAVETTTMQLAPLRKFGIAYDSDEGRRFLADVQSKLLSRAAYQLIQADFNLDMPLLALALPTLVDDGLDEIPQEDVTTPRNRRYDHVLYRGMNPIGSDVDMSVLTDHYPVITRFLV